MRRMWLGFISLSLTHSVKAKIDGFYTFKVVSTRMEPIKHLNIINKQQQQQQQQTTLMKLIFRRRPQKRTNEQTNAQHRFR